MEVILYSKECNWYTRCCPLNGGVRYRECPLREATLAHTNTYPHTQCIIFIYLFIYLFHLLLLFHCDMMTDKDSLSH